MRILVLVTIAILCATSAMAAPFTGGSFETPERLVGGGNGRTDYVIQDGWTTYTNGAINPQVNRYLNDPNVWVPDGAQYGQVQIITTANKYGGFMQTFDVVPGYTYTIKGWYRPLSGSVVARVGVDLAGGTTRPTTWGAELSGAVSVVWNDFEFTATPTGSSMTLFLDCYSTALNKAAAFDYIQVIPEPGSMVALLSGLVGLVGVGIRRRK